MYEVPAHGMLLVCDKAGLDMHQAIFEDGVEAIFYDDIDDAIRKIDHYLADDEERVRIARAGHRKVSEDFWWEDQLKKTLDWAWQIRQQGQRGGT
jgi:spore maturation protein CgeB